jgi:hypothetical protein
LEDRVAGGVAERSGLLLKRGHWVTRESSQPFICSSLDKT